jgi:hypothetical protein
MEDNIDNVVIWWMQHCTTYPCLLCMALDYLTIPSAHFLCFIYYYS